MMIEERAGEINKQGAHHSCGNHCMDVIQMQEAFQKKRRKETDCHKPPSSPPLPKQEKKKKINHLSWLTVKPVYLLIIVTLPSAVTAS